MIRYRVTATRNRDSANRTVILTDYLDAAKVAKAALEAAHPEYQYDILDLRPGSDFFASKLTEAENGKNS